MRAGFFRALVMCSPLLILGACVCNRTVEPVAAPAPAPAPVAEINQTVYFEWDKSNLTEQAQAVITQVSQDSKGPFSVVGNTDTSGGDDYNMALGQRRADAVADALRAQSGTVCSAVSQGESNLAVSTGDGVREPLNRRATITLCP